MVSLSVTIKGVDYNARKRRTLRLHLARSDLRTVLHLAAVQQPCCARVETAVARAVDSMIDGGSRTRKGRTCPCETAGAVFASTTQILRSFRRTTGPPGERHVLLCEMPFLPAVSIPATAGVRGAHEVTPQPRARSGVLDSLL